MKIRIEEALKLTEKYGQEELPIIFLKDIYLTTPAGVIQITQGMRFDETQYDMLLRSNIQEIDVIFTEKLLAKLISNFPDRYRYPYGRKNLIDLDRLISGMEEANRLSKHKRYVISCCEIYKQNNQGIYNTVLRYGERMTYSIWNSIKVNLPRNTLIDYRFGECGIMVYVILKPGDPYYAHKFMKYTEVISLIVEHKREFDISISPDFNPDTDVYAITDSEEVLQTYIDKKPRLIIVADELSDEYKITLAKIKKYDRYARMMVVKNPDPANKLEILKTIKQMYNTSPWEE